MLTRTDIATLAEWTLRKYRRLDPIFIFEGTKGYETREFPHLPEQALRDSLAALGVSFACTDQIGDVVHIFFLCQAWLNRNASSRAGDAPHRFDGVFLYQRGIPSGTWDVAEYKIFYGNDGKLSELKLIE
jgi:hypothetical protein